ncbi:hypothetical protein I302_100679 [Kwoniella bestiolae CBS 10118]|uniref:Uncharacterized protein n=1 Tax=Kwoniella bestiolae CBS 10118 TaxID=1296100 RepID=A0A1B9G5U8_9TREE|nr:hypothetical protein I302_04054 [Kwoniella bestiolae CBS 10118]OCF26371.1 hypothetical protein I302_04054 [Kwoniella bestiolae CBS 10118]
MSSQSNTAHTQTTESSGQSTTKNDQGNFAPPSRSDTVGSSASSEGDFWGYDKKSFVPGEPKRSDTLDTNWPEQRQDTQGGPGQAHNDGEASTDHATEQGNH